MARQRPVGTRKKKARRSTPGMAKECAKPVIVEAEALREAPQVQRVAQIVPLTRPRKVIAQRLSVSHRTAVHVTIIMDADMAQVLKLRDKLPQQVGKLAKVNLSYTHILIKAVAVALREYPIMNSRLNRDQIEMFDDVDIGVAVDSEKGLMVPVIHNADKKSLAEIAVSSTKLAEKARRGALSYAEVTGGTFTITNLGMFGVDIFTPIIKPPECAILGVGRIAERAVVIDGKIVARPIMPLSLSFDHRIVDGATAARFLTRVKHILENPPFNRTV